jgi:predicted TIM-barrel fold metal-dependent hydrolase
MRIAHDHRQIVISTDGHAGADLFGYKPYLELRHHEEFDAWAAAFRDPWAEELEQERSPNNRSGTASMQAPLNWDAQARLDLLDSQGIAAEVLFPNTAPPFYPSGALTAPGPRRREDYELRWAGVRAHNRWLADFCAEAPERWGGFAQVFLDDVDDAVAEARWAKAAGLRGVLLPGDHTLKMANLYYPRFDPLWTVCEELDLPVHRHTSFATESVHEGGPASELIAFGENQFYALRAIGHMILSGVFERHPRLKFVIAELSDGASIAPILRRMDMMLQLGLGEGTPMFDHVKGAVDALHHSPSEYFASNCWVGAPHDVRATHNAGVPNVMWGADIPHSEGCSPFTAEALRLELHDLSTETIRLVLADRAAEVYGFDLDHLQKVADRFGPTIGGIQTPLRDEERPNYPQETCAAIFSGRHAALVATETAVSG